MKNSRLILSPRRFLSIYILLHTLLFTSQCMPFEESDLDPNSPFSQLLLWNRLINTGREAVPSVFSYFYTTDTESKIKAGIASIDPRNGAPRFVQYPLNEADDAYLFGSRQVIKIATDPRRNIGYVYYKEGLLNPNTNTVEYFHIIMKIDLLNGQIFAKTSWIYEDGINSLGEGNSYPTGFFYSPRKNKILLVSSPSTFEDTEKFYVHVFDPNTLQRISKTEINIGFLGNTGEFGDGLYSDGAVLDDNGDRIILPIFRVNLNYDCFVHIISTNGSFDPIVPDPIVVFTQKDSFQRDESLKPVYDSTNNQLIFHSYSELGLNTIRFYYFNLATTSVQSRVSSFSYPDRFGLVNLYWNHITRHLYSLGFFGIPNFFYKWDDSANIIGTDGIFTGSQDNNGLFGHSLVPTLDRIYYYRNPLFEEDPKQFYLEYYDILGEINTQPSPLNILPDDPAILELTPYGIEYVE